jgi:hypothetical protein
LFLDRFLTANSGKNTAQTLDFTRLPAKPVNPKSLLALPRSMRVPDLPR